jgi:hypothetical protein
MSKSCGEAKSLCSRLGKDDKASLDASQELLQ